ncbi:uncharacterized protein LOC110975222 [Acanthaster planci]|uniref:Uncharacterized protein LOC110975222 n=1 Tax=Acanthaster planci TaxID=133434 RepID=A0A8B7XQS8_ACAPL|nr:uncharacterized protein LOC110975222 [Acanthaster planci]XP_022083195.1 uncharacterized protein LOC110975222 [Acanthaster planci]
MGSGTSAHKPSASTSPTGGNMNNNKDCGLDARSCEVVPDGTDAPYTNNENTLESQTTEDKNEDGESSKEQNVEEKKASIAETMAFLMTVQDFATEECHEKFTTLGKISMDRANRLELGRYIMELGFADLYVTIHSNLYSHDLFNLESPDESRKQAQANLKKMRVAYWNFTDCTAELCTALGQTGALEMTIKELTHPELSHDKLKKEAKRYVVQGALGVLLNSIRLGEGNRAIYRKAGAVEILHTLMSCTFLIVRVQCLLTLSYIINEEESEKITASDGSIDTLLTWIREALRTKNHKTKRFGFSVEELMIGLNNLALNDNNKVKIVQKGGLDPLAKMLTVAFSIQEQELAAGLAWKLAFIPSNRPVIQQHKPLIEALTSMRACESVTVREACTGALWETSEGQIDLPGHVLHTEHLANDKHIMISYQWDVQRRMIMLKDQLIKAGYRVWMDVDKMEGDILGTMAEAVENSAVVLVSLSQKYKDSHNTRTEATYAYKQNIPIIPLLVEEDYNADGWLGALVGTLLYFKFFEDGQVEQNLPHLVQEIGSRGKAGQGDAVVMRTNIQPVKAPVTQNKPPTAPAASVSTASATAAPPLPKAGPVAVTSWDSGQVQAWLRENQLAGEGGVGDKLAGFDGQLLAQMHRQCQQAPEFFHNALRHDLGLDYRTLLRLTCALEKLMT